MIKDKSETQKMLVTPALAREWLLLNTGNRPVNSRAVQTLSLEIKQKRWKFNGESIKLAGPTSRLSDQKQLLDGQHRLFAIIDADTSIEMLVVTGLDASVFDTIDQGVKRTGGQILQIAGETNTMVLCAALTALERFNTGTMQSTQSIGVGRIKETLERNPGIRQSVHLTARGNKLASQTVLACCHYLFSRKDAKAADTFMDQLFSGSGLFEGSPVLILRNRLVTIAMSKSARPHSRDVMALIIKSWNLYRQGRNDVRRITWVGKGEGAESYPVVL